ncbi:MAG: N-acetylmuramoyl-L-alanine amidase [Clostridia bacterium]|nr:N-acetylmuramoyl-L-alanine amidase [Clostridia bacterium]
MSRGIIVLDAGHGQFGNPYPLLENTYEGTQNFLLAGKLKACLEAKGFTVLLTRNRIEDDPSLEERGKLAGDNHAVLFLSIHSNAPGSATSKEAYHAVRGSEVYYSLADVERNAEIARALNAAVVTTMNTTDRGIKTRTYPDQPGINYYGVLRHSAAYGCPTAFIIEHGFHTNPEDAAFLASDECLQRLAEAEAEVIDRVL